jgi:hypothetical protein
VVRLVTPREAVEVGNETDSEIDLEQKLGSRTSRRSFEAGVVHEDSDLLVRRPGDPDKPGVAPDLTVNGSR